MPLWPELITLVDAYEQIQSDLGLVLEGKEQAIRDGKSGDLVEFAQREGALAQRLQAFAAARGKLLAEARRQGLPSESLQSLTGAIGGSQGAAVRERLVVASGRSARLRRQSWCHWILAHRSYHHYSQLLEIIAHGGHKPPTYSDSPSPATGGRGGVVLDASV
jgi:flagellar biosynthesis/type III secretory pathway chaperone